MADNLRGPAVVIDGHIWVKSVNVAMAYCMGVTGHEFASEHFKVKYPENI